MKVEGVSDKQSKIFELQDLAFRVAALKKDGKRVALCHGVFDLLHIGHVRHFQEARAHADVLVVTVTDDEHVNKGPGRPAFSQGLRAEMLAGLRDVDFVAVNRAANAVAVIALLKPDVYVKGPDYREAADDVTGGIVLEKQAVEEAGGRIVYTDDITFSSSNLINRFLPAYGNEAEEYLAGFRTRFTARDVGRVVDDLRKLKVVVVGEAILDHYVYCSQLGKSAKEPVLAMRYQYEEMFAGGALAVANHMAGFCKSVELVTYLGDRDSHETFVRKNLHHNVRANVIYKADSPTIVKRRYVEHYLLSKLFEVYEINDEFISDDENDRFCSVLESRIRDADVVVVADFGHGLMTPGAIELLAASPSFLAVNTQINAANIGFHAISSYPRADYICLHEGEVRLDARSRRGDLHALVRSLSDDMDSPNVLVTRGKAGCLFYRRDEGFFESPAFATSVVDRVGSGDAVLSITSLCVAAGVRGEIVSFLANVIGAQKVQIMGNRMAIDRVATLKFVEAILK